MTPTPSSPSSSYSPSSSTTAPTTPIVQPPRYQPPAPRRREPSILGRLTVGAAALAIGGGLLLDNLNVLRVTPQGMFAVLLGIVGVGLLVGTFWGRARWLIIPGVILAFMLSTAAIIPFHTRGGWGDVPWNPRSLKTLHSTYEHSAGKAVLNLTNVKFGDTERTVTARLGFGQLIVLVPRNTDVTVDARVQGGQTNILSERSDGWDVVQRVTSEGKTHSGPLHLRTFVTFGEIKVVRADKQEVTGSGSSYDFDMGIPKFRSVNHGG